MKKTLLFKMIIIFILIVLCCCFLLFGYSKIIDTKYAREYSKVFGSYNINKVDKYLNENTLISYNGKTKTYKKLRNNIIKAFNEKKYVMPPDSYGHGNNKFVNNIQEVGVLTFVEYKGNNLMEELELELERKWLFLYSIRSINYDLPTELDESFFGYLFFDIED